MRTALLLATLGILSTLRADASAPMQTGELAVAPRGFIGFCLDHRDECGPTAESVVSLTYERSRELDFIQARVNSLIRPRPDQLHRWDYPTDGYGDCNRYAIEKRRELIALGWPRSALLLTVAITQSGEGHLVLSVRTDQGDLVLDNLQRLVSDWRDMSYRFVERQSATNGAAWVRIAEAG
jgi:predicted transglutaminase-like cysteine proteinase